MDKIPIILGYNKELDILCDLGGFRLYISLDDLLFIKEKIDKTIDFANNNNIEILNSEALENHINSINKKSKKRTNNTLVYIMFDQHTRFYKIGRSNNPSFRERTLLSMKPVINLLFCYPANAKDETFLKNKYSSKRIRGEWFSLDTKDLEEIKDYLKKCSTR